ncbi:MAG: methyltransferase [Verrucomicrobia bacterium]|nr:methyltransferase [Verrucomicrobiota bacterium]
MRETNAYDRFSSRHAAYAKYRPSYPRELLERLGSRIDLSPERDVADIGAGTGIFTELLLERGLNVRAVEPNADMLGAARKALAHRENFTAVEGTAEATTLASSSVDVVFCAQAFHWFNNDATRAEWRRILRPFGYAVLIWNNLDLNQELERDYYDALVAFSTDRGETLRRARAVQSDNVLFGTGHREHINLPSSQALDFEGLVGRTESLSFAPENSDPAHGALVAGLRRIFDAHQREGKITLRYETVMIFGQIAS